MFWFSVQQVYLCDWYDELLERAWRIYLVSLYKESKNQRIKKSKNQKNKKQKKSKSEEGRRPREKRKQNQIRIPCEVRDIHGHTDINNHELFVVVSCYYFCFTLMGWFAE